MSSKTAIKVSREQARLTNGKMGAEFRRAYWRCRLLGEPSEFAAAYWTREFKKQQGPLNPDQLAEQLAVQEADQSTSEVRANEWLLAIRDAVQRSGGLPDLSGFHTDITPEIAEKIGSRYSFAAQLHHFLEARPHIKTVANIGARVDFYSSYLAPRLPDRQFVSVDFQSKLREHNRFLPQAPNWTFLTGYWLDLLRSGELRADMYSFVSTSVLINNAELNVLFDEVAGHAKALAFCEGWFPKADTLSSRLVPPEDVPEEDPYCGGSYATFHHNYLAKLERRGFEITLSELVAKEPYFHYLRIFAERP